MKHSLKITLFIILFFILTQLIGLFIVKAYIKEEKVYVPEKNITVINKTWQALPYNIERPKVREKTSFIYIIISILIATGILILILKFSLFKLWKLWFFIAITICLAIAFNAFINKYIALAFAFILALLKVIKPNVVVHNLTELFIYGGLAAIFAPMLNIFAAIILLLLIAIYDYIAVYKTKHMVKLAKFQARERLFAGLAIPYKLKLSFKGKKKKIKARERKVAFLGGGDLGFPLLFEAVILKYFGFLNAFIVALMAALALSVLLFISKKDRFYPAMPFIALGCYLGFILVYLF